MGVGPGQQYPSSFLTENVHLILKFKSLYGHFPDPSQVGGIKYAERYLFLGSLMGGHVPQGISRVTKHKLFSVFLHFMKETVGGPKHTRCLFEKKNVSLIETNNVLCDRRNIECGRSRRLELEKLSSPTIWTKYGSFTAPTLCLTLCKCHGS